MNKENLKTKLEDFCKKIWNFYAQNKRYFAWRETFDPYAIVVSEIMLQQTQTKRVEDKYEEFLSEFPDFATLSQATLQDVLSLWQGLGYNRRGKALYEIAKIVVKKHEGVLPDDPEILQTFPGIGYATACSITAFAFNRPTVFIETNVRAVFIHEFFNDRADVSDKEIMVLVEKTVDKNNPREWYYALMDYGVELKKQFKNPSRKSKHHTKQSKFIGSDRQIRGAIIRELTRVDFCEKETLRLKIIEETSRDVSSEMFDYILEKLVKDKMVSVQGSSIRIR